MTSETNITLGEFLRQEREQRGITIEQMASATKINVRMLHALEADHFAELPAKPFVRGFVTSYARFLGLDSQEILTRFGDFIEQRSNDRPNKESGHSGYVFEKREGEQSRTFLWAIMGSFVILGGIAIFVLKPSLRHHRPSHADRLRAVHVAASPKPSSAPVAVIASPQPPETSGQAPKPQISAAPAPSPTRTPDVEDENEERPDPLNSGLDLLPGKIRHKVIFKALADAWVRYRVDEKPMMKFMLRQDRILVLRGKDIIRFQVSNPKAMTFNALNGKGAQPISAEKNLTTQRGTPTLIFPYHLTSTVQDPFPDEVPLPATPDPVPSPSPRVSPTPSPSP